MIFAQTVRYARRRNTFSVDDRFGANVAHGEFLRAMLRYGNATQYYLFSDAFSKIRKGIPEPGYRELLQEFPSKRISIEEVRNLSSVIRDDRAVVYGSGIYISPIAQTRLAAPTSPFPICTLSHSLDIPLVLFLLPGLFLASPFDAVITSSNAGRKTLLNLFERVSELSAVLGHPAAPLLPQIATIPFGIDCDEFPPVDRSLARRLLGISENSIVLLYVGRLSEELKADLEPLLIVVRELVREHPDLELVVAGHDGESRYAQILESLAASFGILDHIRLITNFPFSTKPVLYSASDIAVFPVDNVQETFGLALLEAMACGLPVVASDWSGYREIVADRETGFLVPTYWSRAAASTVSEAASLHGDAVRRHLLAQHTIVSPKHMYDAINVLVEQPSLRKAFGEAGRKRAVAEFGWKHIIANHEALWSDLWDRMRRTTRMPADNWIEDFGAIFAHYPTSDINDLWIEQSRLRKEDGQIRIAGTGFAGSPSSVYLSDLLARCRDKSVSINDIVANADPEMLRAICWLAKKGYLDIGPAVQEGEFAPSSTHISSQCEPVNELESPSAASRSYT